MRAPAQRDDFQGASGNHGGEKTVKRRIKELYYGNIHPYEREIKKDSEIDRLAKLVLKHDAELRKTLNESETELFGKLKDAWAELSGLNECECFVNGFRLAMQLMAESLEKGD